MPIGRFILLSCHEWDAPALVRRTMPGLADELGHTENLIVTLSIQTDGSDRITRTYGTDVR